MSDQSAAGTVGVLPGGDPGPVVVQLDWSGTILAAGAGLGTLLGTPMVPGTFSVPSPVGRSLYDVFAPADRAALHALLVQAHTVAFAHTAMLVGRRDDGLPLILHVTAPEAASSPDGTALVLSRWGGPVAWAGGAPLEPPVRTGPDHVLSHDARASVRNARNFVNLFARKLAALDPAPELPAAHLDTALRALATGDETLDRIVWFMRLEDEPLAAQPIPLSTLVELARRQAENDVVELSALPGQDDLAGAPAVDLRAPEDLEITGHLELLTWTLTELLVNARKFGGQDAAVTVTVDATSSAGFVDLRVANTGKPIDPSLADDAFKLGRMLQARGERPGVGLGLPIARRIITRHGGRIAFTPGAATTLAISLLAAPAGVTTPHPAPVTGA